MPARTDQRTSTSAAAELARCGSFDVARACFIGAQIAAALEAVHARGILHRDLKPENVLLLDGDGHGDDVRVLDPGVAGTPDYMAPEQVIDPASVDSRADVFALGAILYEMLSGHPPLAVGEGEDVVEVVVRRTPAPLGRICPNLPTSLIQTVERALHKDRTKRTQTIREVRLALELFALPSPLAFSYETAPLSAPPILAEAPMTDRRSLPVSAETQRHALLAAAEADRLTAQLAAIAAVSPPPAGARGLAVPLVAGAFGAAAAGVIVFLALRGNVNMQQATSSVARIEATPTGAPRTDTGPSTAGATVTGQTTAATASQMAAGVAVAPPERPAPLPTAKAKHEAAARAAADRGEKEKNDPLAAAAAEVSNHGAPSATALAAAPPPAAPEPAPRALPALAAAPSATLKPGAVLPFGEGMSRPSAISPDEIQFTREAREAKVSGVVIVRCLVTTEGANQNCRIMKSVPMMDAPVLSALSNHKGSPVMYQGRPVSVEYTYTIRLKSPD